MIPFKWTPEGEMISTSDADCPVPHSLSAVIKTSGNYGLADDARAKYQQLVLKPGERPGRGRPLTNSDRNVVSNPNPIGFGLGRGRGRMMKVSEDLFPNGPFGFQDVGVKEIPMMKDVPEPKREDFIFEMFCRGTAHAGESRDGESTSAKTAGMWASDEGRMKNEPGLEQKTMTKETPPEEDWSVGPTHRHPRVQIEKHDDDTASAIAESITSSTPTPCVARPSKTSKGGAKTNGYILFVKHKAREAGKTGTISDFMRQFDINWKGLSEEEKQEWKVRAKTGWRPNYNEKGQNRSGGPRQDVRKSGTSTTCTTSLTNSQLEDEDDGY